MLCCSINDGGGGIIIPLRHRAVSAVLERDSVSDNTESNPTISNSELIAIVIKSRNKIRELNARVNKLESLLGITQTKKVKTP